MNAQRYRCNLIRTLIYSNQSAKLSDIYIPLRVSIHTDAGRTLTEHNLSSTQLADILLGDLHADQTRKTLAGVISGPAGAGKSFFMRNLYLELTSKNASRVPVFIEARELNSEQPLSFPDVIVKAFSICGCRISKNEALSGLRSGKFIVLMDGVDELRISYERHYAKELAWAAEMLRSCPLLISGRPSEFLETSSGVFTPCRLLPLQRSQAIALVEKLEFDKSTKSSFIKKIRGRLWDTHRGFLELPLLCVVMLLTYSDSGRVSQREHEFYEDAYNALWGKHDARKQAGFLREKYTGLDKQDFLKLASAFCASSYVSETFSMPERELRKHFNAARSLSGMSVAEDAFIKDMTVSTSLLVLDGNKYTFSHRSFQEYLCAHYISELGGDDDLRRAIDGISGRYHTDSVIDFIKAMNTERFERAWVIPGLMAIIGDVSRAKSDVGSYTALVRGAAERFLTIVRTIYRLRPDYTQVSAALDSWRHMGRSAARDSFRRLSAGAQTTVFKKDAESIERLYLRLVEKYQRRSKSLTMLLSGN